jgi:hypothetical protein
MRERLGSIYTACARRTATDGHVTFCEEEVPFIIDSVCYDSLDGLPGGQFMKRFVEGADRGQSTLLPECLDEWVEESNSVRVIDCFVDSLDLADLGFEGVEPAATGRPAYHPSVLLKLYIYGVSQPGSVEPAA